MYSLHKIEPSQNNLLVLHFVHGQKYMAKQILKSETL